MRAMCGKRLAVVKKWDPGDADAHRYEGWRDFRAVKERVEAISADMESVGY